jgi:uncharacterized heparinase superfamily protein
VDGPPRPSPPAPSASALSPAVRAAARRALAQARDVAAALAGRLRALIDSEWFGAPLHRALLSRPAPDGLAARPRDFRPVDPVRGRQILRGDFYLGGGALQVGPDGDPWDRPSPTARVAIALHRYGWMGDLLSDPQRGAAQALRLHLEWRRVFGGWNSFSWSAAALERRVFNLACAAGAMATQASDAEASALTLDLARQARHLSKERGRPERRTERAAVVAIAGAALGGRAGERLLTLGLRRLARLLPQAVLADGVHASRSPQAGLELLFDLLTLDDALSQRGRDAPEALPRAIDRLQAALRFFTLADGGLACFQGGEAVSAPRVAAALALDASPTRPPDTAPNGGYQRLQGASMQAIIDAGPPAGGDYSVQACAQPLAIEIVCGRDRLITNSGWSPDEGAPQALRLSSAASTLSLADSPVGAPLSGWLAALLGPRLAGAPLSIDVRRHEGVEGVWLDLGHNGWAGRFGLRHARRLFLDRAHDQLRGEDRLEPTGAGAGRRDKRKYVAFTVRFHLHPDARASLARDNRSVLIKGPSSVGWWLRSDAPEVSIETSQHFEDGGARRTTQVVLRGQARSDNGGRIRWKLAQAEGLTGPA